MAKATRTRRLLVAGAVVGVGVFGIGVAGAVTGGDSTPGPNPAATDHPNSHAWETIPSVVDTPTTHGLSATNPPAGPESDVTTNVAPSTSRPGIGEAPSSDSLSNALTHTDGTPGNTVLNDLLNTAPGPDRGATISNDMQNQEHPTPSLPEQADNGQSHKP